MPALLSMETWYWYLKTPAKKESRLKIGQVLSFAIYTEFELPRVLFISTFHPERVALLCCCLPWISANFKSELAKTWYPASRFFKCLMTSMTSSSMFFSSVFFNPTSFDYSQSWDKTCSFSSQVGFFEDHALHHVLILYTMFRTFWLSLYILLFTGDAYPSFKIRHDPQWDWCLQ